MLFLKRLSATILYERVIKYYMASKDSASFNPKDEKPDYKTIYGEVVKLFKKTTYFHHGPFDETYYTLRVYETCKKIIKELQKKEIRKNIVFTAAILHDVGKIKLKTSKMFGKEGFKQGAHYEWYKHANYSVEIAERILEKHGHSKHFISEVSFLIQNHDRRKHKIKNKTLELQVLQDADLISDCGFSGFIRPFLFSGMFNQSIINSIKYVGGEDRIGDNLNLVVSKQIAKKEMKLQRDLAKKMLKHIKSDILK